MIRQAVGLFPGGDLLEGVHADEKEEIRRPGMAPPQRLKCLDGVGAPFALHFQVESQEEGVVSHRQPDHRQALSPVGHPPAFVGRHARGHEENPVEAQALPDLLGHHEVGRVQGVESAAVDPQPLGGDGP